MTTEGATYCSPNEQQLNLLIGIQQFYKEKRLGDITLVVDGHEFPCNRIVLASSSPYFRAMLTSNLQEREQTRINLYDVGALSLEALLDYMYTGNIDIDNDNVQDLYITANQFELLHVVKLCDDHMARELSVYNCLDLYHFSLLHFDERLKTISTAYILEKFGDVCQTNDFLTKVEGDFLEELMSRDDLDVEKEETVFEAMMNWLKFNFEERESYLPKLFILIRLPLLEKDYYDREVANNSVVRGNSFCRGILSTFSLYDISQRLEESSDIACELGICNRRRYGMFFQKLIIFSGGANNRHERSLTGFDPFEEKSYYGVKPHPSFDFKFRIDFFKMVAVLGGRQLFFLGGIFYENRHFEDAGPALNDVFAYDQKLKKWLKKKQMTYPRCAFAACADENNIYVTGGKSTFPVGDPLDSMEVYNVSWDSWSSMKRLPLRIYHHAATICADAMFLFGGKDVMDAVLDIILRYDLTTKTWAIVQNTLLKPRSELTALTLEDKIYILGGTHTCGNALEVEIYDPVTNRWRFGADFPDERKFTAVTGFDDVIFVCGGTRVFGRSGLRTRHIETRDLHCYNINTDTWRKCIKLVPNSNPYTCCTGVFNLKQLNECESIT